MGALCRPLGITMSCDPGIQWLAVSAGILKQGLVSSPLAMATGARICPKWSQLIEGRAGARKWSATVRALSRSIERRCDGYALSTIIRFPAVRFRSVPSRGPTALEIWLEGRF
jgi:hypothetical protein